VPEFIQDDARAERILPVALELIDDTPRRAAMLRDLAEVRAKLGEPGASARAASEILKLVRGTSAA
jgi:lipid-A-disaccharide synthase